MAKRLVLVFLVIISAAVCGEAAQTDTFLSPVEFLTISRGNLLERSEEDRVSAAVITSYAGLKEFLAVYPVETDLKESDFSGYIYLAVFSDMHYGIIVDSFKQYAVTSYYYCDVADSWERGRYISAPAGRKYSAYALIRVSDKIKISNVAVRDTEANRLTKWYPYPQ